MENKAFRLWIGCGHSQEHADADHCFVEPAKPTVRKGFKRIDTTELVGQVVAAIDRILRSAPEIPDVVWRDPDG